MGTAAHCGESTNSELSSLAKKLEWNKVTVARTYSYIEFPQSPEHCDRGCVRKNGCAAGTCLCFLLLIENLCDVLLVRYLDRKSP